MIIERTGISDRILKHAARVVFVAARSLCGKYF